MEIFSDISPLPVFEDLTASRAWIENKLDRIRGNQESFSPRLGRDLTEVLRAIHADPFDADLNVAVLRERCGITDHNISSRFRYMLGITISKYIEQLRLDTAAALLQEPAVPIFDIALSVGYQHPQTFYRAFRRRFGCTPTEHRERGDLPIAG